MTVESTIPEQWYIYSQSVSLLSLPRVNRSCTCERNMHVMVPLLVKGSCMCEQYLQLARPYHIPWHFLPGHTISHAITCHIIYRHAHQAIPYAMPWLPGHSICLWGHNTYHAMPARPYHISCHVYPRNIIYHVGGWVGRWCWVASSTGASCYFGIWLGRGLLC